MPTVCPIRRKPRTPLSRTGEQVHRDNRPNDAPAEPDERPQPIVLCDPATMPRDLLYQRERAYAICMSYKFGEWLAQIAARDRIAMDDCLPTIVILTLYVEAFLVAAATWPHLYPTEEADDEDEEPRFWTPRTVADANAAGLAVVRKGPPRRPAPTLPGCHGHDDKGASCQSLREYGHRFCPVCERAERARLRAM